MRKLDSLLIFGLSAVVFASFFREHFPSMAALYGMMTGISVLYGLGYLRGQLEARLWRQRNVPAEVQRVWSRRMGVLYLANAALCPLGFLLRQFLPFDQDLILVAQVAGFFILCFASVIPVSRGCGK